jgi:hypothetical protein
LAHGLSATDLRRRDNEQRKGGYEPVDVAGYLDGEQEHYTALWVRAGPDDAAQLYVGLSQATHESMGWGPLRKAKFQPATLQVFVGLDRMERYSSVWRKSGTEGTIFWNDDEGSLADRRLTDGPPLDLSLFRPDAVVLDAADLEVVAAEGCEPYVQDMRQFGRGRWSKDQQLFCTSFPMLRGGYVEFAVDWPEAGRYQLAIFFTQADDYGKVEVALDGTVIGERFDGFNKDTVEPSGKVDFGTVALRKGRHRLRFTAVDKNPKSKGYLMGIERLEFRPGLRGNLPDRGGLYRHSRNALGSHPELRYAGCFLTSGPLDYAVRLGLTPAEQLRRCRDLAGHDYRPASLSVAEVGAGQPLVTAFLWQRPGVPDEDKERLAERQSNAAVALLRMNHTEKVWPLLKHSPDPRVRSYLIHRLSPLGADAGAILKRFDAEEDITIRRALLLSLGEYSEKDLPRAARLALLPKLQDIYRTNADPGLHAAAEWLLRQWKQEACLKQVNDEWANNKEQREKRWESIRQRVNRDKEKTPPQWYVNSQGQTMVVIAGPVEFLMGSPPSEADRSTGWAGLSERQHKKRIGRSFALAATPVTQKQFLRFKLDFRSIEIKHFPAPSCPIGAVKWFEAVEYLQLAEPAGRLAAE